jgi:cobalt-zinc-cadmium efflux system protein
MSSHAPAPSATTAAGAHRRRLVWVLGLTSSFLLVEVVAGLLTGSLALLADAGHMLTDVGGLALSLLAIWFAGKPPTPEKTYGYYRVEILAALINALVLLGVSAVILYEAYRRFLSPSRVLGGPMLAVAVVGLGVNLIGVWLLRPGSRDSLNLKGAYLEVASDALASLGVIVAAVVVLSTGWTVVDAIIGGIIGLFVIPRTWALLTQAVNVLLEGTPAHLNLGEVARAMLEIPGTSEGHDLHVWTLTSGKYAMSGHVQIQDPRRGNEILHRLHALLHERFSIEHTTSSRRS